MEISGNKIIKESWKKELNILNLQNGDVLPETFQFKVEKKDIQNTIRSTLPSGKIIMHEPCIEDFFINGESAGAVESSEVLEDWLLHIDCLLEKAATEKGLEIEESDISNLFVRKSTILCTLGLFDSAKEFARHAIDIQETSIGYYRLAIAQYCLHEYDLALETLLHANDLDGRNLYIQHALQVVLIRIRSRKDRPDIVDEDS